MSFGREAVSLPKGEVDRLVGSLRDLGSPQGDSMAEEISALTLAGVTIDLRPTNAELGALVSAVVRIGNPTRASPDRAWMKGGAGNVELASRTRSERLGERLLAWNRCHFGAGHALESSAWC
jgi:hypothetical protein